MSLLPLQSVFCLRVKGWCMDLKGWFHNGDGARCEPFTVQDAASRFFLRCRAVPRHNKVHVLRKTKISVDFIGNSPLHLGHRIFRVVVTNDNWGIAHCLKTS